MQKFCSDFRKFDAVHLGHQKILDKVKEIAEKENLGKAVMSFNRTRFATLKISKYVFSHGK